MDLIDLSSLLNLDEVVQNTKLDSNHVTLFYGLLTGCSMENPNYIEVMKTVAEHICGYIRKMLYKVINISFIKRTNDENITICISSNSSKVCKQAVAFAVDTWMTIEKRILKECDPEDGISPFSPSVQIQATVEQLNKRIQSFLEHQREQTNINNIKDFCKTGEDSANCARVDAVLRRRKDATSHIQVRKVNNDCGPQLLNETYKEQHVAPVKIEMEDEKLIVSVNQIIDDCDSSQLNAVEPESGLSACSSQGSSEKIVLRPIIRPVKSRKRKFTIADLENKLDTLKRRALL